MLNSLVLAIENAKALKVSKNPRSQELTIIGQIMFENGGIENVTNVVRFPTVDKGFTSFGIQSGAAWAAEGGGVKASTVQQQGGLYRGVPLRCSSHHLVLRQREGDREQSNVLASFPSAAHAEKALASLSAKIARKRSRWNYVWAFVGLYLIASFFSLFSHKTPKADNFAYQQDPGSVYAQPSSRGTVGGDVAVAPQADQPVIDPATFGKPNIHGTVADPSSSIPVPAQPAPVVNPQAQPAAAPAGGNFGFDGK